MKKFPIVLLVVLALSLAVAAGVSAAIGPVVNPANGHFYELVSSPGINWHDANTAAAAMNMGGPLCAGHLVTVTSASENAFIVSTFGASSLVTKWIGAYQAGANSSTVNTGWQWVTGEAWSYTNWNAGEPNNGYYGAFYGYEDAANFWIGGYWNDAPSEWNNYGGGGFVVEYECMQVQIDIKPGSNPNSFNNNDRGVIPVAILTTATFDAATVDPFSVTLDGATVRVKGRSGTAGSLEDVDGDGDLDLVVQIQDTDGTYQQGDTVATLTATTFDGMTIKATDTIRIVP
jgi:hypothetical protein